MNLDILSGLMMKSPNNLTNTIEYGIIIIVSKMKHTKTFKRRLKMDGNKTITITENQLMDAMFDLAVGENSRLKELTDKSPMLTLLFPIIGCELWEFFKTHEKNSWVREDM